MGSVKAAQDKELLKSNNITHILIVGNGIAPIFPDVSYNSN